MSGVRQAGDEQGGGDAQVNQDLFNDVMLLRCVDEGDHLSLASAVASHHVLFENPQDQLAPLQTSWTELDVFRLQTVLDMADSTSIEPSGWAHIQIVSRPPEA
jgi:hypothetical protein